MINEAPGAVCQYQTPGVVVGNVPSKAIGGSLGMTVDEPTWNIGAPIRRDSIYKHAIINHRLNT